MKLGAAAAAATALLLGAALSLWRRAKAYDGLNSIISFSSKLIAASRAVESSEQNPLVSDPLAEGMAGAAALASCRRRAAPAPPGSERQFKVGKMAIRTRWFDDQIEAALGMPVAARIPGCLRAPGAAPLVDRPSYVWAHPSGLEPRQVVMLGAGMDSRPWRMKLPADLRWFEVDQPDVVEAKRSLLAQLTAEVPLGEEEGGQQEPTTPSGTPKASGLARHLSIDKTRFPLRCGSWAAVPADLTDPSWAEALLAAGFDPEKPTVWVAEGLLMYLEGSVVEQMLRRMAELSPAGSVFVALSVTSALIDRIRARQKQGSLKGSLMATWVWGCPEEPAEFLSSCGWQLQMATDRTRQAAALGLDPELCSFGPASAAAADAAANGTDADSSNGRGTNGKGKVQGEGQGGGSLFLVATPAAAAVQAAAVN